MPLSDLRTWMLNAADNGMTGGDYVFIYVNGEHATKTLIKQMTRASVWKTSERDDAAKKAFKNLLIVSGTK